MIILELKFKTEVVHNIKDHDWDSFIKGNFPKAPYEGICCEEELKNGSTFSHTSAEIDLAESIKISDYLDGNSNTEDMINTGDIINCLVTDTVLPEGLYNINICW